MKLKDLEGRLTLVLTPELRQFALDQVRTTITDPADPERMDLVEWFQEEETPDGYVLDAARTEAEATMIDVVLRAILDVYAPAEDVDPTVDTDQDWDRDAEIRLITR